MIGRLFKLLKSLSQNKILVEPRVEFLPAGQIYYDFFEKLVPNIKI